MKPAGGVRHIDGGPRIVAEHKVRYDGEGKLVPKGKSFEPASRYEFRTIDRQQADGFRQEQTKRAEIDKAFEATKEGKQERSNVAMWTGAHKDAASEYGKFSLLQKLLGYIVNNDASRARSQLGDTKEKLAAARTMYQEKRDTFKQSASSATAVE